ncbi:MAG TPA: efflux RND transporter periplasmic adaptor subunit [bacterium]|nr:efflux RND transporter periplasmic adaptor subunit [bacterium]HPN42331.1 efflux RND transporter periplasmic adaptor subunit [bacterium]
MIKKLFILFGVLQFVLICCKPGPVQEIETYTLKRGEFLNSVTETGELDAVNSITILSPTITSRFPSMKIARLVEDGAQVVKGDTLCEFDVTEVQKGLDDAIAELEIARAELRKAKSSNESTIQDLEAEYEKTRLQHEISKLNLEKAKYESEIRKKEIQLELDRAAISLEKARQEIENQKSINREQENKLALQVKQVETRLQEARSALNMLCVVAPAPGIAILERNWTTDEKYQVNDQVWRGNPLIKLPDLSRMRAQVPVNEVDIAKIDTLQRVKIRLDAYPDSVFTGQVTEIATLARNKERDSKVKVFDVYVQLDRSNPNLMPGMTVSCEIIIESIADTLFIPVEALFHKEDQDLVYLKKGGSFKEQPVKIGPENEDYVIITAGLEPGDEVALINPEFLQSGNEEKDKSQAAGEGE